MDKQKYQYTAQKTEDLATNPYLRRKKQQVVFGIRKKYYSFRNSDDIPTYACSAPLYIQNRQ